MIPPQETGNNHRLYFHCTLHLQVERVFPSTPLQPPYLPSFDGRAVIYPNSRILRDYMSWRQVDCE